MSTVSGPTPMSTTSTTTASDKSRMSSVVTETATPRINGSLPTASAAPDETPTSSAAEPRNTTTNVNTASTEVKEEPRAVSSASPTDLPLPADLKRILAEVARTGSCSWLPWNSTLPKQQLQQQQPLPQQQQQQQEGPAATEPTDTTNMEVAAAVAAVGKSPPFSLTQQSRRPYSKTMAIAQQPPRKKHRNGVKVRGGGGGHGQSRKRPLFLIRTSGGSVGSNGRTSGSEPDDSTQYECDSEGTSATSCSELSTERNHLRNMQRIAIGAPKKLPQADSQSSSSSLQDYHSLKDVFRMALGLVLDHWYRQKGGYKLSPAEKRRSAAAEKATSALVNGESNKSDVATTTNATTNGAKNPPEAKSSNNNNKSKEPPKAEVIFQKRKQRLLVMLGQPCDNGNSKTSRRNTSAARRYQGDDEGPPFTIQRIAEVLIAPERYYTQTHKLCNCLEKLLLVTSSTSAFGGSTGGITSQSRLEERELAALANEKGRLETEFRQRALKRRNSAMSDDLHMDGAMDAASRALGSPSREEGGALKRDSPSPEKKSDGDPESSSREMLEAAARSLRTKFDHVGIDPHSSAVANRDVRSIAENRGMTNSPPPPSLAMAAAAASNIPLSGHCGVGNFVRQHHPEQNAEHASIARVPSPILFSQNHESPNIAPLHAPPNINLLHMHHAAPLAGVSVGSTPFDVVTIDAGGGGASAPTSTNLPGSNEGADLEGRSSASNSDVDSESDDVSFDDSASDRSDGSDSGHYEPFTAARAMALSRIQQQQRLHQNRGAILTSLALHQNEGVSRPPADSEYQSGDSIDSTRGEDSGGSDSSSSDLAD